MCNGSKSYYFEVSEIVLFINIRSSSYICFHEKYWPLPESNLGRHIMKQVTYHLSSPELYDCCQRKCILHVVNFLSGIETGADLFFFLQKKT